MSPFVMSCVDSFRDAYARTGMNLVQSIVVVAVGAVRWGGRKLGEDRRKRTEKGKNAPSISKEHSGVGDEHSVSSVVSGFSRTSRCLHWGELRGRRTSAAEARRPISL